MHTKLQQYLFGLGSDTVQTYGAVSVLPLIAGQTSAFQYLSLSAAMARGLLVITELSKEGRVPNLNVRNDSELPVLLLDGEELKGAKQNRILNTSVLVAAQSELVVPVSCTEAGRWGYSSPVFSESGNVLPHSMRVSKLGRVSTNLTANRGYDAGQGQVWSEISQMQAAHNVSSQTSAMRDVFENMGDRLNRVASKFPLLEGQCGIYVEVNGKFAGLDLLSLPSVWKDVHAKIIRSYAIDFLRDAEHGKEHQGQDMDRIFKLIGECETSSRKSVGLGDDHRFSGPDLLGSSLVIGDEFIHTAVYPRLANQDPGVYHSRRSHTLDPHTVW